ncbi:MAG TPA: SRPBCC family protein [Bacteroidales bacterium]|nr:SRPBCC family protein [Bacteroidales bacterium]
MKTIKLKIHLYASSEDIYNALTNSFAVSLWTGLPATMDDKEGTEFSLWEGDIVGRNIEMIPNEKIVQEWYFGDQEEQSIVTIKLHKSEEGTQLEVIHTNIPDDDYADMLYGWKNYYLGSLKEFFDK